jgi:hypothetical protein
MSKKSENLIIALQQVSNLEKLIETFDYPTYMTNRLNSVKYELERQLHNCRARVDKK